MFYIGVLIFSISINLISEIIKNKNLRSILLFITLFCLWIISSLRYDIGTDYVNYVKLFDEINSLVGTSASLEIGFKFIVEMCSYFDIGYQSMFALMAGITITVFFYSKKMQTLSGIFAFITIAYLPSFSLVRQVASIAFVCTSAFYLLEHNVKKSIVAMILGCLFHSSAILFIPFIIFRKIKVNPFFGIISLIVLYVIISKYNLAQLILDNPMFRETKYGAYSDYELFNQQTEMGTGLGVLLKILPSLMFILFSYTFRSYSDKQACYISGLICLFNYAYIIAIILSTQIHIFNRLADTFLYAPILAFVALNTLPTSMHNIRFVKGLFVIAMALNFILTIYKNPSAATGGLGIYPYQTILFN